MPLFPAVAVLQDITIAVWNNLRTLYLGEHLDAASGLGEHAKTINLGAGTDSDDRKIKAKLADKVPDFPYIGWDESDDAWVLSNNGTTQAKITTGGGTVDVAQSFIPPYDGGLSELTSTPTSVPPAYDDRRDTSEATPHHALKFDNSGDAATNTGDTYIKFRVKPGITYASVATIKLFNKVSAAHANTFVTVTMKDTADVAVTLTGGAGLSNLTWTETTITVGAGTFTVGGYATIKISHSAKDGHSSMSGELTLTGVAA